MSGPVNPIVGCIEELRLQAEAFLDQPHPRVLRWLLQSDEGAMINAFIAVEGSASGTLPALLVRLDTAFDGGQSYGEALREAFIGGYDAQRETLAAEGWPADWTAPEAQAGVGAAALIVSNCVSYLEHYADILPALLLTLLPRAVSDASAFSAFILEAARLAPPSLRFIVTDDVTTPSLGGLDEEEGRLVSSVVADLDVQGAASAAAAGLPDADAPSGQLRQHFIALGAAAKAGDLPALHRSADAGITVARAQGWLPMVVTLECARGAALSAAAHPQDAIASYGRADDAAARCMEEGDPMGPRLRLTALMGMGSALIAADRMADAAPVYERCAPLALKAEDPVLHLESWRMAAFCHEQAGALDLAWERGGQGLSAGADLDDDQRQSSTLPYLGACLLRLCEARGAPQDADLVHREMEVLLGTPDWAPPSPQGDAHP